MSDTPKRLTWEEIGANKDLLRNALHGIARMDCPGDHIVGARYDDNDGKECKDCDACWEPYMPEAAPTDVVDESDRLRLYDELLASGLNEYEARGTAWQTTEPTGWPSCNHEAADLCGQIARLREALAVALYEADMFGCDKTPRWDLQSETSRDIWREKADALAAPTDKEATR
jgi:hypothetical protein